MSNQGLSGTGLLMLVIGVWLILRTVTQDSTGRTLIDHITGKKPSGPALPWSQILKSPKLFNQALKNATGSDTGLYNAFEAQYQLYRAGG